MHHIYKSRSSSVIIDSDDDGFIISDILIGRELSGNDNSLTDVTILQA